MRLRPVRHTPALLLGAIALGAAACGGGAAGAGRPQAPAPPVLSAAAVAYLPSTARRLSAAGLAREIRRPALAARAGRLGVHRGGRAQLPGRVAPADGGRLTDARLHDGGGCAVVRRLRPRARGRLPGRVPDRAPVAAGGRVGMDVPRPELRLPGLDAALARRHERRLAASPGSRSTAPPRPRTRGARGARPVGDRPVNVARVIVPTESRPAPGPDHSDAAGGPPARRRRKPDVDAAVARHGQVGGR